MPPLLAASTASETPRERFRKGMGQVEDADKMQFLQEFLGADSYQLQQGKFNNKGNRLYVLGDYSKYIFFTKDGKQIEILRYKEGNSFDNYYYKDDFSPENQDSPKFIPFRSELEINQFINHVKPKEEKKEPAKPVARPFFSSDAGKLALVENKKEISAFASDPAVRAAVSAPLRAHARAVAVGKGTVNPTTKRLGGPLASNSGSLASPTPAEPNRNLLFPAEGVETKGPEFISQADYQRLQQDVHVYYDRNVLGGKAKLEAENKSDVVEKQIKEHAKDVVKAKSGMKPSEAHEIDENRANLVTFVVPTRIGYTSDQKTGAANRENPQIAVKVLNFTYPKFNERNDPETTGKRGETHFWIKTKPGTREKELREQTRANIRQMLRLNIIAACDEYQRQGVALPFILNLPGAFLRGLDDNLKLAIKKEIAQIFVQLINSPELKDIVKANISEIIAVGGVANWGPDAFVSDAKAATTSTMLPIHVVDADIISMAKEFSKVAKKADGSPAEILIPMMGEPLGAIGNGALGDAGNSDLDEDLFRRCLGLHALLGNGKYNGNILADDNIKSTAQTLERLGGR